MVKYQRLSQEERKKEIRDGAIDLFLEKGYSRTSMEDIVDSVNLSKGSVYKYYPTKEGMLLDLLKDGMTMRNAFLLEEIQRLPEKHRRLSGKQLGKLLTRLFLSKQADSKYAELYSIFLYEKKFHKSLEMVYEELYQWSLAETFAMIREKNIELPKNLSNKMIQDITSTLNTLILGKFILSGKTSSTLDESMLDRVFQLLLEKEDGEKI